MEQSSTPKPPSLGDDGSGRPRKTRRQSVDVACVRCRERKIRCDGAFPCSPCKQRNITCREPENKRASSRGSLEQRVAKLEALAASNLEGHNHPNTDTLTSPLSPAPQFSTPEPQQQWLTPPSLELQIPNSSLKPPPIEIYSPPDDDGMGNSMPFTIPTIGVTPSSRPHSPFTPSSAGPGQRPFTPSSASSTESWSVPHSPAPSLLWPLDDSDHGQDARPLFDFSIPANDHLGLSRQFSFPSSPHQTHRRIGSTEDSSSGTTLGITSAQSYSAEPSSIMTEATNSESHSIDEIIRNSISKVAAKSTHSLSTALSSGAKWPAAYGAQIMADRSHADSCANAYFSDVHPLYPFLNKTTFGQLLDVVYNPKSSKDALPADVTTAVASCQVYMVLAIGALVLRNQRGDSRVARDTYCLAAVRQMEAFEMWNSISGIQCSLLFSLVCLYDGALSKEAWTLKSNIVSTCIELGLHRMPQSGSSLSSWDALGLRVFLSAYFLDRNIGIGFDRPFSISEEDTDIESLISFLRDYRREQHISPPDSSLLAILTGVYQIISSSRRMQRLLKSSSTRHSSSLLCDPTQSTVMNWRSQTFQKLELLRAEFLQLAQTPDVRDAEGKNNNPGILIKTIELKIQEAILSLFHPSEQTISPLTQPEIEHAISTARLSLVTYKRLWVSRKLFICTTTAKSVYMCGETLALLCLAEGGNGEGNVIQPEMGFCFDILADFTEIGVARELMEKLRRLVG